VTTPQVRTFKKGGSRFYVHPKSELSAPGVTSVVGMLPKEFLKFWAAKVVAEHAVDNIGPLVGLAMNDREGAIDWLKRAPQRFTGGAADLGTEVHGLYEALSRGQSIGRVHPDIQPFIDNWHEWNEEFAPEFLHVEGTVWNDQPLYAGSFDAIAVIGGETVIIDYKTTRSGVHAEVALQLAAYASADSIITSDGDVIELPVITGAAVMHSRPEAWKFVPVSMDPALMGIFEALTHVIDWQRNVSRGVIGAPLGEGQRPMQ